LKPGSASADGKNTTPVFFAIHIDSVTGRQSAGSDN
jgi:hypothetical protein